MIDIHSHLLPGIDDGPRDWEQSVELCRSVYEDGIRTSVATPHLIDGVYDNLRSRVEPLVAELNRRLTDAGIGLEVLAGAEVDISSGLITSASDELPRLGPGSSVLLEMPVAVVPAAMDEIIFALRSRGLIPVLAHPERNEVLQQRPTLARAWIKSGAALQLDGDSLLGVWGRHTQRCGERILQDGLFHAMASDAHSVDRRPPRLAEALDKLAAAFEGEAIPL